MRSTLKGLFGRFSRSESGATLVEYGIAVVLAVIVGTGGLIAMANSVNGNMNTANTAMTPVCDDDGCDAGAGFGTP